MHRGLDEGAFIDWPGQGHRLIPRFRSKHSLQPAAVKRSARGGSGNMLGGRPARLNAATAMQPQDRVWPPRGSWQACYELPQQACWKVAKLLALRWCDAGRGGMPTVMPCASELKSYIPFWRFLYICRAVSRKAESTFAPVFAEHSKKKRP